MVQYEKTRVSNEIRPDETMSWRVGDLVNCEIVRMLHVLPHEVVRDEDGGRAVTRGNRGGVGEDIHRMVLADALNEFEVAKRRTVYPCRNGGEPGDSLQCCF